MSARQGFHTPAVREKVSRSGDSREWQGFPQQRQVSRLRGCGRMGDLMIVWRSSDL
jgi:hypothetical protein